MQGQLNARVVLLRLQVISLKAVIISEFWGWSVCFKPTHMVVVRRLSCSLGPSIGSLRVRTSRQSSASPE